ncbi:MAG: hypothetical protein M3Z66_21120 [Chloroflexota bacterium]|nr:hypothetical protein [Chloroflexota bacterium]
MISTNRLRMTRSLGVAMLLALALPFNALASPNVAAGHKRYPVHLKSSYGRATITFGIEGGNMRPWSVTFNYNGSIVGNDYRKPTNTHLYDPKNSMNGLQKLADAEGFGAMPATQQCTRVLPDVASRFVTISTAAAQQKVSVRGFCNTRFNELWAVLASTTGFAPNT